MVIYTLRRMWYRGGSCQKRHGKGMQHLFRPQAGCGMRVSLFHITRQGPWRGRCVGGKEAKTESACLAPLTVNTCIRERSGAPWAWWRGPEFSSRSHPGDPRAVTCLSGPPQVLWGAPSGGLVGWLRSRPGPQPKATGQPASPGPTWELPPDVRGPRSMTQKHHPGARDTGMVTSRDPWPQDAREAMTAEPRQTQGADPSSPSPQLIPRTHTHTLPAASWKGGERRGISGPADDMVGRHHQLRGHESKQAMGDGEGQGSLVCCGPWGRRELDTTERLNWTELNLLLSTFKWN